MHAKTRPRIRINKRFDGALSTVSVKKERVLNRPNTRIFSRDLTHSLFGNSFRQLFKVNKTKKGFNGTISILDAHGNTVSDFGFNKVTNSQNSHGIRITCADTLYEYQRHGFMKQGLSELIAWAKKQPAIKFLTLEVDYGQGTPDTAVNLYKSLGFVYDGVDNKNDLIFTLKLPEKKTNETN